MTRDAVGRFLAYDERWPEVFLAEFIHSLGSVTLACDFAAVARCTPYKRRQSDPVFRMRWEAAQATVLKLRATPITRRRAAIAEALRAVDTASQSAF